MNILNIRDARKVNKDSPV